MLRHLMWLFAFTFFLSACQSPFIPSSAPTTPTLSTRVSAATPSPASRTAVPATRTRVSTSEGNYRIEVALFDENGRTAIASDIGSKVPLTIAFRPSKDVTTRWSDGSSSLYSEGWSAGQGVEMRFCTAVGRHCTLPDQWMPFEKERHADVTVGWVGLSTFEVVAQFRDASGKIIPAGVSLSDTTTVSMPIEGIIAEQTPVASQPPAIQTTIAQARAAYPVTGSVKVGEGSATGGKAGTTVNIPVKFEAHSPAGPLKDMRIKTSSIGRCLTPDEMNDASWEPFVPAKTYPFRAALNWTTFKLHVQYRDVQGNLSPVYCGEIAVEGQP